MTLTRLCLAVAAAVILSSESRTAEAVAGVGGITGRVFNPTTGEYVASAEVRVAGTGLSAVTEQDGVFRLANVPAGPCVLTGLSLQLGRSSLRDVDWQIAQTGGRDFAGGRTRGGNPLFATRPRAQLKGVPSSVRAYLLVVVRNHRDSGFPLRRGCA